MSRSKKGSPRCPERKCSWCGGKAAADHRDAMHMQTGAEIEDAVRATLHYDSADWEGWPSLDESDMQLWNECLAEANASHRDPYDVYDERVAAWYARAEGEQLRSTLRAPLLEALLDSPDFKPDALAAFEARGYARVNRRG